MRLIVLLRYSFKLTLLKLQKNSEKETEFQTTLLELCKRQGGLYVKFIQVMAMQTSIFTQFTSDLALSLYDNVAYDDIDIVEVLRNKLSHKQFTQLREIELKPFSAGAFAQVYKAKLGGEISVIIKVKKSGLKQKLFVDFLLLRMFLVIIETLYEIPLIEPRKIYERFKRNTYRELDYITEVKNGLYLYKCYQNNSKVRIPKTYADLCTKDIIVQEFIEGLPLTKLIKAKNTDGRQYAKLVDDYNIYVEPTLWQIGYQLAIQGPKFQKFYGDPHPGNVILLGGDKFALVDFGILDEVQIDKRNFYNIMHSVVYLDKNIDYSTLAVELLKFGSPDLYHSLETLAKYFTNSNKSLLDLVVGNYSQMMKPKEDLFLSKKAVVGGFTEIFYEILKIGDKFNLRVPDTLFNMMRSSAIFASYARFLLPDSDVMPSVYEKMLEDFKDDDSDSNIAKNTFGVEDAIVYLNNWITGLAEKDTPLYTRIRGSFSF